MSYARPYRIQQQRQGTWTTIERHEDLETACYAASRDQSMRESEGRYVPPMRVLFEDRDPVNNCITYTILWGTGTGTTWTEDLEPKGKGRGQFAQINLDPKKIGRAYLRFLDFFTTFLIRAIIVGGIFLALIYFVPWAIDLATNQMSDPATPEAEEATGGDETSPENATDGEAE